MKLEKYLMVLIRSCCVFALILLAAPTQAVEIRFLDERPTLTRNELTEIPSGDPRPRGVSRGAGSAAAITSIPPGQQLSAVVTSQTEVQSQPGSIDGVQNTDAFRTFYLQSNSGEPNEFFVTLETRLAGVLVADPFLVSQVDASFKWESGFNDNQGNVISSSFTHGTITKRVPATDHTYVSVMRRSGAILQASTAYTLFDTATARAKATAFSEESMGTFASADFVPHLLSVGGIYSTLYVSDVPLWFILTFAATARRFSSTGFVTDIAPSFTGYEFSGAPFSSVMFPQDFGAFKLYRWFDAEYRFDRQFAAGETIDFEPGTDRFRVDFLRDPASGELPDVLETILSFDADGLVDFRMTPLGVPTAERPPVELGPAVPEPSSLLLFAVGSFILVSRRLGRIICRG